MGNSRHYVGPGLLGPGPLLPVRQDRMLHIVEGPADMLKFFLALIIDLFAEIAVPDLQKKSEPP